MRLDGRVALVTGGSRGIGRDCAIKLAQHGADVVINYISSRATAEEAAAEVGAFGGRVVLVKGDVSEDEDVFAMRDFVQEYFGRLDVVVSNAATGGFRPLLATTKTQFNAAMNINARAVVLLAQAFVPLLEQGETRGKIIALSSAGATMALPMYGLIGATKAALESLVRHLALELGQRGINVNTVRAGLVDTDSIRRLPTAQAVIDQARQASLARDRLVQGRDIGDLVVYLASDLGDMIQGQTLIVDGGLSIVGRR